MRAKLARMERKAIHSARAPKPVGTYSQAVRCGQTVYLSGQIPLDPATMDLVGGSFEDQVTRVLENLKAVCEEVGGSLADIAKLTVYLADLANFVLVNQVMEHYFHPPYPARAAVEVAALPLGASVEIDGVMHIEPEEYSY